MAGFFGKLPAHGDFVRRGLPPAFVAAWDAWLCAGVLAAGEDWTDAWQEAAPLRFHASPGRFGPAAAGVLLPSLDAAGRRFPLTIACCPAGPGLAPPAAWFAAAEALGLAALADATPADALHAALPPIAGWEAPPAEDALWRDDMPPVALPAPEDFAWTLR